MCAFAHPCRRPPLCILSTYSAQVEAFDNVVMIGGMTLGAARRTAPHAENDILVTCRKYVRGFNDWRLCAVFLATRMHQPELVHRRPTTILLHLRLPFLLHVHGREMTGGVTLGVARSPSFNSHAQTVYATRGDWKVHRVGQWLQPQQEAVAFWLHPSSPIDRLLVDNENAM